MITRAMVEEDIEIIRGEREIVKSLLVDAMNDAEGLRQTWNALSWRLAELRLFRERGIFDEEQVKP